MLLYISEITYVQYINLSIWNKTQIFIALTYFPVNFYSFSFHESLATQLKRNRTGTKRSSSESKK